MRIRHFILLFAAAIALVGCKKEIKVPAEVNTLTMSALLQEPETDAATLAAYTAKWPETFTRFVNEKLSAATPEALAELQTEVDKVREIAREVQTRTKEIEGTERVNLRSSLMAIKNTLDTAENFLAAEKAKAEAEAKAAEEKRKNNCRVYCSHSEGYINIYSRPTTDSEVIDGMFDDGESGKMLGSTGSWIKLRTPSGFVGYCRKSEVRLVPIK